MLQHRIAHLLKEYGPNQVTKWVDIFSQSDRPFAVVKISGKSIDMFLPEISDAIATLSDLELIPVVVYGWGDMLNTRLELAKIENIFHKEIGDRITRLEALPHLERISEEYGLKLRYALEQRNTTSRFCNRVFEAVRKELSGVNYDHYTGRIIKVNLSDIEQAIKYGEIPIVTPLATDHKMPMNINADSAGMELVKALAPQKYIALTNEGGILDLQGKIIKTISIEQDYDRLVSGDIVIEGKKKKLDESIELFKKFPDLTCDIIHPTKLLEGLVTDEGEGTQISR